MASGSCSKVYFSPGAPETDPISGPKTVGSEEPALRAARKARKTLSKASPVNPMKGTPSGAVDSKSSWNAPNDEPALLFPMAPRIPSIVASASTQLASVSEPIVLAGSHEPVRVNGPLSLAQSPQKVMNSHASGSPWTACCASVSSVAPSGLKMTSSPMVPPAPVHAALKTSLRPTP